MSRREWKIYRRVRYRARASTSSLKSNRDPLPRFYCQAGNHSPQGNVDLHRFQHGGLPTLRLTLVGQFVSIAPVPMRKGSSLIALDQPGGLRVPCPEGSLLATRECTGAGGQNVAITSAHEIAEY